MPGAVASVVSRAAGLGLTWAAVEPLTDDALERRLYGPTLAGARPAAPEPDPVWIHTELRRQGVTLELLHLEYLAEHPDGYRYSAFCGRYRDWLAPAAPVDAPGPHGRREDVCRLRRPAAAAGRPRDRRGASRSNSLSPCSAPRTTPTPRRRARSRASTSSRVTRAPSSIFGGVSGRRACRTNCAPACGQPCRYEPGVQRTYADWARHYDTVIIPARPAQAARQGQGRGRRPGRRALDSRAAAARDLLHARRAERAHPRAADRAQRPPDEGLRRAVAARTSSSASTGRRCSRCRPTRFVHADWRQARVNIDYHVEVDRHYYSVPHPLDPRRASTSASRPRRRRLSAGQRACGCTAAASRRAAHDHRRAHAEGASRASGVEPVAPDPLGRHDRAADRGAGPARSSRAGRIPSRAIAPVSACCASSKQLRPDAARRRLCPGAARRRPLVSPRRRHPQARPGPVPLAIDEPRPVSALPLHDNVRGPAYYRERRSRMMTEPTVDRLRALRLGAMADAYLAQQQDPDVGDAQLRRAPRHARRRRAPLSRQRRLWTAA